MDERKKIADETREYLRDKGARSTYLTPDFNKKLTTELAHRVLARRDWLYKLSSFDEVFEVVSDVVRQEAAAAAGKASR